MKTICVLTQEEHVVHTDIVDEDVCYTLIAAYSSYDDAIRYMDNVVLSFINELIFRGCEKLNYRIDFDYTKQIQSIGFYYGSAESNVDFKTLFNLEHIDLIS